MSQQIIYAAIVVLLTLASALGTYIYRKVHAKDLLDSTIQLDKWITLINDLTAEVDERSRVTFELKAKVDKLKEELQKKDTELNELKDGD